MAGYFTKLNGRVFEGHYPADVDLENGTFVVVSSGEVVKSSANTNIEMECVEKTDIWGLPALRLRVQKEDGTLYMVEQDPYIEEVGAYDGVHRGAKAGELVKMRSPHISDEILLQVSDALFAAAAVGYIYNVAANGLIAKKA